MSDWGAWPPKGCVTAADAHRTPPFPPILFKLHPLGRDMSLSTNRGMSALMGSQPCLKMLTMTVIQSKNG